MRSMRPALALVHPFPQSQTGTTVFTVLTGLAPLVVWQAWGQFRARKIK